MILIVVALILVALAFDFINGFHDAANSIATVVSTRVLSPLVAVGWAAFFNFVSAAPVLWGVELKVAATMGKGIVEFPALQARGPHFVLAFIFAALVGAIVWNLLTWWWGLPSSSSHALAGGMIGACLVALGPSGLIPSGIWKIVAFIVLSPLIGMVLGSTMMVITTWIVRRQTPARVDHWFRRLQLVSAAIFSYSHGTNDAQKVMGIITVILYGTVWSDRAAMTPGHFPVPFWVVLSCHAAIGLGTMFGGWRIVRTMGHNLTKLQPIGGFCAETGGGVTILALAHAGIPVSTTHTITGAIVGVSATKGARAVRFPEVALAPDGGTIAFTSSRSGAVELWTVAASAGATPRQVTTAGERVTSPDVGPDGTMVFGSDHGGDERYDLFVVRPGAAPARASGTPAAELRPRLSPDGHRVAYVADRDRPFRTNLFVRDLEAGAPRALTRGEVPVLGPVWSRDGRLLAAVRTPDEEQHGELLLVDVDSGAVRVIPPPSEDGLLAPLAGLPDGRFLARATNAAGFLQLAIVDPRDGSTRLVGPGDWDVEWAAAADDGSVAWLRNVHGRSELAFAPGPDPFAAAPRVLLADGVVSAAAIAMDRAGRRIALVDEAPDRPARLAVIDPRSGALEVVVTPEAGGADLSRLPRAAMRTFRSFDGTSIDAWLWTPPAALLGSPPPCVVLAHGGPSGQVRGGFAPLPLALAEAGFVVVAPNFRGSTGYGRAFEDLNNKDWGGGDLGDLLAVVDALAAAGTLDRARVGITGGSYGGYLTLRAITAAPDRFAAAVDLFGMPDLAVDYELTKDRFGLWYETEMGTPATEPDLFRARSPIHALDRVRAPLLVLQGAPLLVLQGANDTNVPRAESEEVVEKLRRRGAAVEYVLYPGEGHGFTHRANVLDAHRRTVAFFVRYLGGAKPAR